MGSNDLKEIRESLAIEESDSSSKGNSEGEDLAYDEEKNLSNPQYWGDGIILVADDNCQNMEALKMNIAELGLLESSSCFSDGL